MKYRPLGTTGMTVSAIDFGAWAIGGSWGAVDDEESMRALHASIDAGVNFVDTADVYGDGRSERLVARLRRERPGETIYVATKAGRRLPAQTPDGYTSENLRSWIDRSLSNLDTDAIDLLQLHCPHPQVYDRPEGSASSTISSRPASCATTAGATLAQFALRWILMFDPVSAAIPGARTAAQARENAEAASLSPIGPSAMAAVREVYDQRLRPLVHGSW